MSKFKQNSLFLLVVVLGAAVTGLNAQVTVSAGLDTSAIMIGDQVQLQLFIEQEPGTEVTGIELGVIEKEGLIEIVRTRGRDTVPTDQKLLMRQSLVLTSFDSGYHFIPPIPITFTAANGRTDTVFTDRLALLVNTFPITADSTDLQPIKNIIGEPINFWDVAPYLGGAVVLGALIAAVLYYQRRREYPSRPKVVVPPRPPHEVALEKLAGLRAAKTWQQGQVKQFHSELTYILREYLEKRYHIQALEFTTDEIERAIRPLDFGDAWKQELVSLFRTADLVKFAKGEPPVEYHEQSWSKAHDFVVATKEVPGPPEQDQEDNGLAGKTEDVRTS